MNTFFEINRDKYDLSEESISLLRANLELVEIPKKTTFVDSNRQSTYLYFVSKGVTKSWFLRDGVERIWNFAFEGDIITIPNKHSKVFQLHISTLEDSILYRIEQYKLDQLLGSSNELAFWGYRLMQQVASYYIDDYMNYFWRNKKDAYRELILKSPDILQRIPLKDVASYLNITPSSLSRIRKSIW